MKIRKASIKTSIYDWLKKKKKITSTKLKSKCERTYAKGTKGNTNT